MALFFPSLCPICKQALRGQEDGICFSCLNDQPLTWMELKAHPNPVEELFVGHLPIVEGYALWYYRKESRYRPVMHAVKYKGNPRLGCSLGRIAGKKIAEKSLFTSVDLLIPIPLHWRRQWMRGFNQSEQIAKGLADILHLPIDTHHLRRTRHNEQQALLSHEERNQNVQNIFSVRHPEELAGKHILLIDDVCTTGSTLLSAMKHLRDSVQDIQISVFTLYTTE